MLRSLLSLVLNLIRSRLNHPDYNLDHIFKIRFHSQFDFFGQFKQGIKLNGSDREGFARGRLCIIQIRSHTQFTYPPMPIIGFTPH